MAGESRFRGPAVATDRMPQSFIFDPEIIDKTARRAAVASLRRSGVRLPTWSELADPSRLPVDAVSALAAIDPDAPAAGNLWRVHWYNDGARTGRTDVPGYLMLPESLTGVKAPIVVLLGCRFPMIGAHKVLPAYACLIPRLVTGRFDPARHRAVWPSTGNYCRGGVAISRILGCRGVAVLPEGMSRERFDWLDRWVADPGDIVRTPGTESNVKEIYDACAELAEDDDNVILNQFSEFANYVVHYHCTGAAFDRVFGDVAAKSPNAKLAAFVAASGSSGTLGAGDYLKERHGARIAAVEAVECPTMLMNGYGEHNIQGIGDKHIPLIHNVMNMDVVIGVSDKATDGLNLFFGSDEGRRFLARNGVPAGLVAAFADIGISGLANIVAAIKLAKHLDLGPDDVLMTVATDSAAMYGSERDAYRKRAYPGGVSDADAAGIHASHLAGIVDDHVLELTHTDRTRIFNLGYYTWVEQQGVSLADFDRRKDQSFWQGLRDSIPAWDAMIADMNAEIGKGH
jgi:cysteine synthase A